MGGGGWRDHMVSRRNRKGISRRQKSVKGRLWKIDFQLTANEEGILQSLMGRYQVNSIVTKPKSSNLPPPRPPNPRAPFPSHPVDKKLLVPKLSTYRWKRMKSNRIDESKTATINDDSVNTGLRLINFNSTCPWSPFLF